MEYTLGFSPCPNDTFIFDALLHGRLDTKGLSFRPVIEDVAYLNKAAFKGDLDITKLSYFAYAHVADKYQLLNSGSALGRGCGPLVISKQKMNPGDLHPEMKIAIPGKYTTAHFLFSLAFPDVKNKVEMIFSDIEDAVVNGDVDAGLIIHENRFTYQRRGLHKVIDLGDYWENETGYPIPLGGIAVNRNITERDKVIIDRVLKSSVEYAFAHPEASMPFTRLHAQAMEESVMQEHIKLYVNEYSVDLSDEGRKAVEYLLSKSRDIAKLNPDQRWNFFVQ